LEYPDITIFIATYNYEKYIGEAIKSILEQDYDFKKIEIIIIDDGSIDNTKKIVDEYLDKINIIYIFQKNKGKAAATRLAIELASGKYLFNLDADDFYYPSCLRTVVEYFESDVSLVQVSHLANRLDQNTGILEAQQNNHKLINSSIKGVEFLYLVIFKNYNIGLGSTFSGRTSMLKNIEIIDEIDMYIDLYLFLMLAPFGNIMQLDKILSVFRRHTQSYSEGTDRIENSKVRDLRYTKSAKALYDNVLKNYQSKKIINYYKYFHNAHLLTCYENLGISKTKIIRSIIIYTITSFWLYKRRINFLYNNSKLIIKNLV
jgi:glycosyltransferase involved in cell wall biosynthesis